MYLIDLICDIHIFLMQLEHFGHQRSALQSHQSGHGRMQTVMLRKRLSDSSPRSGGKMQMQVCVVL